MAVSIVLMCEILDFYRGPDRHKLFLLAWAERASTGTRSGWCPRRVLAGRLGVSPTRVSHIASELVREGTIKRDGYRHRYTVYVLSPLRGQGPAP